MNDTKQLQESWYAENAPLGRRLGYPECCIRAFGNDHPTLLKQRQVTTADKMRYTAACVNGKYTGFIPCADHAAQIAQGKITLQSLIQNRDPALPGFPNY